MSDKDTLRSSILLTEKSVLTELLQLYKSFPCLWNQKHILYNNKEARQNAYDVLLEKYKLLEEDASLLDVKKKIEHMRCAYRREHKKVIYSRIREREVHKPVLWYYNLLTFLNDHSESNSYYGDSYQIQETHEIEDSEDEEPDTKKVKTSCSNNAIYVSEHQNVEVPLVFEQQDQDLENSILFQSEPEAFGRTVGYQLKELTQMQRIYAEKLISEVIYHARLGKLHAGVTLELNDE